MVYRWINSKNYQHRPDSVLQGKTPEHFYDDLKTPSSNGENGEFGAKDIILTVAFIP